MKRGDARLSGEEGAGVLSFLLTSEAVAAAQCGGEAVQVTRRMVRLAQVFQGKAVDERRVQDGGSAGPCLG